MALPKDFAVFVDRDGTINVDVDFLSSPSQLQLIPRSADAIRELNDLDIPVVVITNQSGIARGLFTEKELHAVHEAMDAELLRHKAKVLAYFYCPHHPNGNNSQYAVDCECRKPKPGMLTEAKRNYGFDLTRSYVIGDKCIDIQTGKSVGAVSIQVATGYGAGLAGGTRPPLYRKPGAPTPDPVRGVPGGDGYTPMPA